MQVASRDQIVRSVVAAVRELVAGVKAFSADRGSQLAASISYYSLLSLFPAVIAATAILGLVLGDDEARRSLVDTLDEALPLSAGEGRSELEDLLLDVTRNAGTIGLVGVVALIFSGSALIGSIRASLAAIFNVTDTRDPVRGKLFDIGLSLILGLIVSLSFGLSIATRLGLDLAGELKLPDGLLVVLTDAFTLLAPPALTAIALAVLYRLVPRPAPSLPEIWRGLAFAVVAVEVVKVAFSFYLEHFADYNAVYGSLGAIIAYLAFIYLATTMFLIGAELVALRTTASNRPGAKENG